MAETLTIVDEKVLKALSAAQLDALRSGISFSDFGRLNDGLIHQAAKVSPEGLLGGLDLARILEERKHAEDAAREEISTAIAYEAKETNAQKSLSPIEYKAAYNNWYSAHADFVENKILNDSYVLTKEDLPKAESMLKSLEDSKLMNIGPNTVMTEEAKKVTSTMATTGGKSLASGGADPSQCPHVVKSEKFHQICLVGMLDAGFLKDPNATHKEVYDKWNSLSGDQRQSVMNIMGIYPKDLVGKSTKEASETVKTTMGEWIKGLKEKADNNPDNPNDHFQKAYKEKINEIYKGCERTIEQCDAHTEQCQIITKHELENDLAEEFVNSARRQLAKDANPEPKLTSATPVDPTRLADCRGSGQIAGRV